ncbi:MAG TPA: tRNA pseudouridine(55) synthase TruB [Bacteroidales bacterium]|nr:tRNA pseudouridine(55) synthase TruB [Bacteroidales bacterium]
MHVFDGQHVDFIEGQLIVANKPMAWTSLDVVNKIRSLACKQIGVDKLRVGHAGTLDPMATGVLLLCTGRYTKHIEKLQDGDKEYVAKLKLGATTPSFDMETEEDAVYPYEHITQEMLEECITHFTGPIEQVPPVYSAVKIGGKRSYKIARRGRETTVKPRLVEIYKIGIEQYNLPFVTIRVSCGKGTYIRALARDIGKRLNSGAYVSGLVRTKSGDYTIENALEIEEIEKIIRNL